MTFSILEESRQRGQPITLYFIRYGDPDNAYLAYTDSETPVSAAGTKANGDAMTVTYEPYPIERGPIVATGTLDKSDFSVIVPEGSALYDLMNPRPPSTVVTLVVRQGHAGDTEFLVAWMGRIVGSSDSETRTTFTCQNGTTSMRRQMVRRDWNYGCPYVLYGRGCRADKEAATVTATVASFSGTEITLTSSSWETTERKPKYVNGLFYWTLPDGRLFTRSIVEIVDADTISVDYIPDGLANGMTVELVLGCNHQMDDCDNLHDNIQNFGGQPLIPTDNPIGINRFW